ncbi:MAG: tetratricopeptide repeat protein [Bacteroidia bacterium]|nr:tetratricopeptide repeat protein [Bacteroidia bacterium]MDW8301136.1 tetratricopeptide repeat protein [Bacteroidia bacterium]
MRIALLKNCVAQAQTWQDYMQKGNALYQTKEYDSASFYFRKAYQYAAQQRNLSHQKESIKQIIAAELYAFSPDTALKYANLMWLSDFQPYEIYFAKENIFRRFLYYDSAALYAAKYSQYAPKSDTRTEVERLKAAVTAYYEAYYYDLALFHSKRLLNLCEEVYSKNSSEYAEVNLLIAAILAKKGEVSTAKTVVEQAIKIYQKYSEKPEGLAYALYAKSVLLTELGNYLLALNSIYQSIVLYKKQYGEQYIHTAKAFLQLGILHEKMAKYDSALYYQRKALTLFKNILPENDLHIARVLQAIGTTYFAQRNYEKAEEYYQNALFIQKQHYVEYHPQLAETYKNLGAVMEAQKDAVLCYRFYELANNIYLRTLGTKHIEVAQSYINLGTAYFLKKEHQKSLNYYLKGLHLLEHNPQWAMHEYLLQAYQKLSFFYQTEKDYEKAIQYAEKAVFILKNKVSSPNVYLSEQYLRLAALYRLSKQYIRQVQAYQNAIDALCLQSTNEAFATPTYKNVILEEKVIPLLIQKANLIIENYSYSHLQPITLWLNDDGKTAYQDSQKEYELNSSLNALELVLELKLKLFRQGQYVPLPEEVPQKIIFLSLHLYQFTRQKHYLEKIVSYSELFARFSHQFAEPNLKFYSSTQDTLTDRHAKINKQISNLKKELIYASKNDYKVDTQWVNTLVKDYQKAQQSLFNLWQNAQKYAPDYYFCYHIKGLNTTFVETQNENLIYSIFLDEISKRWKKIQDEQHPLHKAHILHYLPLPNAQSVALLVSSQKTDFIPLPTTSETFKYITAIDSAMKQKNFTLLEQISPILYSTLFEPIKNYLTHNTLIVFLHGNFSQLCIENLIADKKNTLIQKYRILYAFSVADLFEIKEEKPKTTFAQNYHNVRRSVSGLENSKLGFKSVSNTVNSIDILHTDTPIDYKPGSKILSCYLYISSYCNTFVPYMSANCITLRYPLEIETEQFFWREFYESLSKSRTIWDSFYTAQQKVEKNSLYSVGCFRLFIGKI